MTKRAKWAFEDRAAADAFVKANGGTIATFDEAIRAAYDDMYQDTKMIREKRKAMRAKAAGAAPAPGHGAPAAAQPAPAAAKP
jgi:copper chaperone NosL